MVFYPPNIKKDIERIKDVQEIDTPYPSICAFLFQLGNQKIDEEKYAYTSGGLHMCE
jgi:hypothetical protein